MRGALRLERLQPWIDPLLKVGLAPAVAVWALSLGTPVGAHAPGCLFKIFMDHECWGCGTLRAMAALLRLDLSAALALNPLSPLVAATLVALSVSGLLNLHAVFGRPSHG
ncbi:MAG: hypothetical protein RL588_2475 [Pseudomonadota bacterium]|jgi:hypothetical protein